MITDKVYQIILELPPPRFFNTSGWVGQTIQELLVDLYYAALAHSQYFSPKMLHTVQEKRIKILLRHAQESVPFYSSFFNKETEPKLLMVPPISKSDMRKAYDDGLCISKKYLNFKYPEFTSGSTGVPFHFLFDKNAIPRARARYRRMVSWVRKSADDHALRLIPREYIWVAGEGSFLECADPNDVEKNLGKIIELSHKHPLILQSRTSHLVRLAQIVEARSLEIPLRGLISYTEQLYSPVRDYIERALNAPIFNFYACNEITAIGFECEQHDGFHVLSELVYVEVLDGASQITESNVPGDIVVTSLDNYVMPFIRYKIGDRGWWMSGPCLCGRTLPRIQIEGRDINAFLLPNGKVGHMAPLVWPIATLTSKIIRYQAIRHTPLHFEIKIVPTEKFHKHDATFIVKKLHEYLGDETKISLVFVDDIERTPGGKTYAFVNRFPDFGPADNK